MNINHTGGKNIFGSLSRLQHHLASLTVDCHMVVVQTEANEIKSLTRNIQASQQMEQRYTQIY